jgi:hypothetical protein
MEMSYIIIETCVMILSIITIFSITFYIFAFFTNSIPNKKSGLSINYISHKNNHTRKTNNKNYTGAIVNFEKRINDEISLDDIMLASYSIQEEVN